MSEDMERPPWWMSDAGDADGSQESGERGSSGQAPGLGDMWSLLGMLGNMRDMAGVGGLANLASLGSIAGEWWESSGASTHTEHVDPSAHPECLICKVLVGLQAVSQQPPGPSQLPPAHWLSVRRA